VQTHFPVVVLIAELAGQHADVAVPFTVAYTTLLEVGQLQINPLA